MKQPLKRNDLLRLNTSLSLIVIFLGLIVSLVIIKINELKFANGSLSTPRGGNESFQLPYKSDKDEGELLYKYNLTFQNTHLFSGDLQIIPDDCIESFSINGRRIPDSLYKDKCDFVNGFYLNINPYLGSGLNKMELGIRNKQGFYGLNILDQTFYEKYVCIALLILILFLVKFKELAIQIKKWPSLIFATEKKLIWILFGAVIAVASIIFWSAYADDLNLYILLLNGILLISVFTPILYLISKKFSYPKVTVFILLLAFLIWILYLAILPHTIYSYDNEGHLAYIQYINRTGHVPIPNGGWSFYHPSLYYLLASKFTTLINTNYIFNYLEIVKLLQTFSLMIFLVYMYISLATIDIILKNFSWLEKNQKAGKRIFTLTTLIFIFWTSNTIFAVRVGNDSLFNLFFAASFYFIVKWWFSEKAHYYLLSLCMASLDVWAKTNGLISFGIIFMTVILRHIIYKNTWRRVAFINRTLIFFIAISITAYFSFHKKIENKTGTNAKLIVGNVQGLGHGFDVGNGLKNYLTLNPYDFINIPFTSSLQEGKGREFFLFYLFKTSMFGEFTFDKSSYLPLLAKVASALFLIGIVFWWFGLFSAMANLKIFLPVIVCFGVLFISMAIFRFFYPFSCSNDFRYIFPTVLPASIIVSLSIENTYKYPIAYKINVALVTVFIFVSLLFQIISILNI